MRGCWACRASLPHVHREGADCPHERSDGSAPGCCADEMTARVELAELSFALKTGRARVPDDLAGLVPADDDPNERT